MNVLYFDNIEGGPAAQPTTGRPHIWLRWAILS